MTEVEQPTKGQEVDKKRSTREIRHDIAKGAEDITQKVDEIGGRIQEKLEKLDWREYVRDHPTLAMAAAAGLGYVASGIFIRKQTPMERILGSVGEASRNSIGSMIAENKRSGFLGITLLSIAATTAVEWLANVTSEVLYDRDQSTRTDTTTDSDTGQKLNV